MGVRSSETEKVLAPSRPRSRRALADRLRLLFGRARVRRQAGRMMFLAPAAVFLIIFIAYPVVASLYLSFVSPETGAAPTLENYESVLGDRDTLNVEGFPRSPPLGTLVHNAIWVAIHLPLTMFIGLGLALILREVKGASFVKGAIFIGMVTPMVVGGVILRYLYSGNVGLVPRFFEAIGVEGLSTTWLARPELVLFGLIFGSVWLWTGFSLIVYSAGLTTIPKEYFEAAKIDGASPFRMFARITFPLLRPITLVVVTMTILWELKIFDLVFVATGAGGGPGGAADVLALQMYRYAFRALDFERAAVVATLLTLLTLLATVWLVRRLAKR